MAKSIEKQNDELVKRKWLMDDYHPLYGRVVACGSSKGDTWRMFTKNGVISLIPLECCGVDNG